MTMIQIQEALIAKELRATRSMHQANARAAARKQLIAKGYSDAEAQIIVRDALEMADLQRVAA